MRVDVDGVAATIASSPDGITVNGVFCAEPDLIDRLQILGFGLADRVTLTGSFTPGFTSEPDWDEIEIFVDLGAGNDTLTVNLTEGDDEVDATAGGVIHLNDDGDGDITVGSGVDTLKVMGKGGNDSFDFFNHTGARLYLYGGNGDDYILGHDTGADWLYGDAGNDTLAGYGGNDVLFDGPGADALYGGAGNDRFEQGTAWELFAGDYVSGESGSDTLDYGDRTGALVVTPGNALDDDGEQNERDNVEGDVEKIVGGIGDDLLFGTSAANTLTGGAGNDQLYGLGGVDTLYGGDGNDRLFGDAGGDKLYGDAGDDDLLGAAGNDTLRGGDGSDVLDGGDATDSYFGEAGDDFLYNNDSNAETVDCGAGTDDPEPDIGATDTFIACELI
ncbi:MAG TPA: calcium-binding protein [Kofleriaceae bacterium]|nr:calcium-binding protein [Kofleriaceae bacterium]